MLEVQQPHMSIFLFPLCTLTQFIFLNTLASFEEILVPEQTSLHNVHSFMLHWTDGICYVYQLIEFSENI